jgi:hypothetical protein
MIVALCIALLALALEGPTDSTGRLARPIAWCVGMLGILLALVVLEKGWPL